jgi:hypothetical protein
MYVTLSAMYITLLHVMSLVFTFLPTYSWPSKFFCHVALANCSILEYHFYNLSSVLPLYLIFFGNRSKLAAYC